MSIAVTRRQAGWVWPGVRGCGRRDPTQRNAPSEVYFSSDGAALGGLIFGHAEGGTAAENENRCPRVVLMRGSLFLTPTQSCLPKPNADREACGESGRNWESALLSAGVPCTAPWHLQVGKGETMPFLFVYLHVSVVCRKRANLLPGETLRRPVRRGLAANTRQAR